MEFFVYSRRAVELIDPHEVPHIFISITTPGDPQGLAKLPENQRTLGVLRLSFHDFDSIADDVLKSMEEEEGMKYTLFGPSEADQVVNFVDEHLVYAKALIVHCDAGVSRSPATAASIAKCFYKQDDSMFFKRYHPNMRVYRGILEAHFRNFPDD
jgi:predicted protein tyrosine phosphatase